MKKQKWMHLAGIGSLALFSSSAHADFFIHSWDNHHTGAKLFDVGADLLWYRTTSNYDSNGSTFTPLGLNSYQRVLLDVNALVGITSRLSLYGRLDWEMSKVDSTNPAAFSGTAYGLGDQTLGINYRIYDQPHGARIDLQGQIDFPAYSTSEVATNGTPATTSPDLGDATVDVTAGAFISYLLSEKSESTVGLTAGAGYTYRSNSFSSAIPWSAELKLQPRREGLLIQAGAFGIQSLNTDGRPNIPTLIDTSATSLGTGGSYITHAINPSQATLRAGAGWRTASDLQFTGTVAQSVWGHEAPNGLTLTFGFLTHFGGEHDSDSVDPALQDTVRYGRSNKGYVNYGLEGKVLRANDRFNLVKIDKGSDQGVQVGDPFDIFMNNPDGSVGPAIARGRVTSVKGTEAAIKIDEYFREVWIEEGFTARRPIAE